MGKFTIPDGWQEYSSLGEVIPDSPFVAFKTPLVEAFFQHRRETVPEAEAAWTPQRLFQTCPRLAAVVDLTKTQRYYKPNDLKRFSPSDFKHIKIMTDGHGSMPTDRVVQEFFSAVDSFVSSGCEVVGVHCTHGVNRTGYLICRYLIQKLRWAPEKAVQEFERCRGHGFDRDNYRQDLLRANWRPVAFRRRPEENPHRRDHHPYNQGFRGYRQEYDSYSRHSSSSDGRYRHNSSSDGSYRHRGDDRWREPEYYGGGGGGSRAGHYDYDPGRRWAYDRPPRQDYWARPDPGHHRPNRAHWQADQHY